MSRSIERKYYGKKAFTIADQIKLLKSRGLIFPHENDSISKLHFICYYRFLSYCKSFQEKIDIFDAGTSFDDVLELYDFDRQLRLLCFDIIERIETSLKSIVSNILSLELGPFWIETEDPFIDSDKNFNYLRLLSKIVNNVSYMSKEDNNLNFYRKYKSKKILPLSWILMESLNFNDIIKIYRNLKNKKGKMYKRTISKIYNIGTEKELDKYLEILNDIRNKVAHHDRLWNIKIKKIPKNFYHQEGNGKMFNVLIILSLFISRLSPRSTFTTKVINLIKKFKIASSKKFSNEIGLPKNWEDILLEYKKE